VAVNGRDAVRLATEHRSSKSCAHVLQLVETTVQSLRQAAARAAKEAVRAARGRGVLPEVPSGVEAELLLSCVRLEDRESP
jgi:hypothetical protein